MPYLGALYEVVVRELVSENERQRVARNGTILRKHPSLWVVFTE
jgi:hypothetical protein